MISVTVSLLCLFIGVTCIVCCFWKRCPLWTCCRPRPKHDVAFADQYEEVPVLPPEEKSKKSKAPLASLASTNASQDSKSLQHHRSTRECFRCRSRIFHWSLTAISTNPVINVMMSPFPVIPIVPLIIVIAITRNPTATGMSNRVLKRQNLTSIDHLFCRSRCLVSTGEPN